MNTTKEYYKDLIGVTARRIGKRAKLANTCKYWDMTDSGSLNTKRYIHDCINCTFLGNFQQYDIYFCKQTESWKSSLIARYGSEGSQYASMPFDMIPRLAKDVPDNILSKAYNKYKRIIHIL